MARGGGGGGSSVGHMPSVMDTMAEIVQLLAQAKLLPDAQGYMQLIGGLEQGVLQIIDAMRKQTAHQAVQGPQQGPPGMAGQGGGPPGGPPGMGGMGGPPDTGPGPASISPGGGSGMAGFGTPNPDELRRTLAGPAAVGGQS